MNTLRTHAPRLLAGFGTAALVAAVGLFASSRPAHTAGGPIPVTVANAPLPTTPTDVAAPSQPVGVQLTITVIDGFGENTLYTVPVGKRLVIESLSGTTDSPAATPSSYTALVLTNNLNDFTALRLQPGGSLSSGTETTRLYADPGTTVNVRIFSQSDAKDLIAVSLAGYLVDAPGPVAAQPAPQNTARHGMATQP